METIQLDIPSRSYIDMRFENLKNDIQKILEQQAQPNKWLTKKDYADRYDLSIGSVENAERRGEITTKRIGRRVFVLDTD